MNEFGIKKSVIISRQILLYFVDYFATIIDLFDRRNFYRIPIEKYDEFRTKDKEGFRRSLYRLKQVGYIKEYYDEKGKFIELTPKGRQKLKRIIVEQLDFSGSDNWDKKWRIVIFDVPEKKNKERDILRHKLESIGFFKLQESVYVYPFECFKEIQMIRDLYYLKPYVQYLVADRIETEVDLIKKFTQWKILDIKKHT